LLTNSEVGYLAWQRLLPKLLQEFTGHEEPAALAAAQAPRGLDLDIYTGCYEALNRSVTITRDGERLFAQARWHGEIAAAFREYEEPPAIALDPIDRRLFKYEHPYRPYQAAAFTDLDGAGRPHLLNLELRAHRRADVEGLIT
jgi:hypothetical protein